MKNLKLRLGVKSIVRTVSNLTKTDSQKYSQLLKDAIHDSTSTKNEDRIIIEIEQTNEAKSKDYFLRITQALLESGYKPSSLIKITFLELFLKYFDQEGYKMFREYCQALSNNNETELEYLIQIRSTVKTNIYDTITDLEAFILLDNVEIKYI